MNTLITIISIILFLVLSIIVYNGLSGMDNKKKIIIFLIEIIMCFVFTMILFNISSLGIEYPNSKSKEIAMKTMVAIFRTLNESQSGEIKKEECKKRLKKSLIIFLVLLIIEFIYLKNVQNGILSNYNMKK